MDSASGTHGGGRRLFFRLLPSPLPQAHSSRTRKHSVNSVRPPCQAIIQERPTGRLAPAFPCQSSPRPSARDSIWNSLQPNRDRWDGGLGHHRIIFCIATGGAGLIDCSLGHVEGRVAESGPTRIQFWGSSWVRLNGLCTDRSEGYP